MKCTVYCYATHSKYDWKNVFYFRLSKGLIRYHNSGDIKN